MASLNKVILMGNLTRDPELRTASNGLVICKFSIAMNRTYKAQDGSQKEEVTYVDVDAFARQAETIARYMTKGSMILIEGRLKLDQWESKEGEKRSRLGVVLENFQFVGSKQQRAGEPAFEASAPASTTPARVPVAVPVGHEEIDEDVPF